MDTASRRGRRSRAGAVTPVVVVVLAVLVGAMGCASAPEPSPGADGEVDPVLLLGRDLWGPRCASCHGADGSGGVGPRLGGGRAVERFPDPVEQEAIVRDGIAGRMPAFGEVLSAEEIEAVVRYVREVL